MLSDKDLFDRCWNGERYVSIARRDTGEEFNGPVERMREIIEETPGVWFSCAVEAHEDADDIGLPDVMAQPKCARCGDFIPVGYKYDMCVDCRQEEEDALMEDRPLEEVDDAIYNFSTCITARRSE